MDRIISLYISGFLWSRDYSLTMSRRPDSFSCSMTKFTCEHQFTSLPSFTGKQLCVPQHQQHHPPTALLVEVTSTTPLSPTEASCSSIYGCQQIAVGSNGPLMFDSCSSTREFRRWTRDERRRRRRATDKYRHAHASRERTRVEAFNVAFGQLRRLLPTLPPDKKLSKIEILRLAICYIAYLNHVLDS